MNGYELSRIWFDWCFENPEKINTNHSALYFFAIEHCNRLGWRKKFGFPTEMAKDAIGIKSYRTYINTLNDLVEWGFIEMIERSKNQYSANIVALVNFDKALDKALDKAMQKHDTKQRKSIGESNDSINKHITLEPINQLNLKTENDLFFDELILSEIWLEQTAMQTAKKFNIEQVKEFLKKYNSKMNVSQDQKQSKKEYCSHFVSWLDKQELEIKQGPTKKRVIS